MLDCSWDTDCEVELWTYSLTCLTNLKLLWLPAWIYNGTWAWNLSAKYVCKILQKLEVLSRTNTTTTRYKNLCIHDILDVWNSLRNLKDLYISVIWCETWVVVDNLSLCTLNLVKLLHNAWTYSSHLRTVVWTCDCSDCVTTKCWTSHKKLIVLLLLSRDWVNREITDLK